MRVLRCLALILAATVVVSAQQPGPPPPPTGSGVILGRVVDATSNVPIAAVVVALIPAAASVVGPPSPPRTVLTDRQGRFVFRQLAAGSYTLQTRMGGTGFSPSGFIVSGMGQPIAPYLPGGYGQRRPNGGLQPLELAEGERMVDAVIRLWKGGAVEGIVFDEASEPLVGAVVSAVRRSSDGRLIGGPTTNTDDRGAYHLGTLLPGDYVIVVPQTQVLMPTSTIDAVQVPATSGPPMNTTGIRVGRATVTTMSPISSASNLLVPPTSTLVRQFMYQSTFYPSAVSPRDARSVAVASGQTRAGLDIRLQPVRAVMVSGGLTDANGPVPNLVVRLAPADEGDGASVLEVASSTTDGNGQFTFPLVPSGQYTVWSRSMPTARGGGPGAAAPGPPPAWASQAVSVSDQPVSGIVLMMRSGLNMTGRVEFHGSGIRPAADQLRQLAVIAAGAEPRSRNIGITTTRVAIDPSDQFSVTGLSPGRYVIRAPETAAWRLESVSVAGVDVTDEPIVVGDTDLGNVVVAFTDRVTEIRGTVTNSRGEADPNAVVVLFPTAERRWPMAVVQTKVFTSARTAKTGAFVLRNLVPGDYFVAAIADDETLAWPDETFLRRLSPLATRRAVAAGDIQTVTLRSGVVR